jgi:hypothetical protein
MVDFFEGISPGSVQTRLNMTLTGQDVLESELNVASVKGRSLDE